MNNTKSTPHKNKSEEYVFIEKTSSSKDGKNPRFIFAKTEDIKNKINIQDTKDMSFFSRIKFLFSGKKMREKEKKLADEIRINKMRTDAADQIQKILERPDFKKVRGAEELLKDIKESKSVKSEDLRRVLNSAAYEGIQAFPITDATSQESSLEDNLRDSLHAKFTALDNLYLISQEDKSSQDSIKRNITFAWGEVKEENKPSNKHKIKVKTKEEKTPATAEVNRIQNKSQKKLEPGKISGNTNEKNKVKENIPRNNPIGTDEKRGPDKNNSQPETDAVGTNYIKNNSENYFSGIKPIKDENENSLSNLEDRFKPNNAQVKKKYADLVKETNLREKAEQDNLIKNIHSQLRAKFDQNNELNKNIYEGLNKLISHAYDINLAYDDDGNQQIIAFMNAINILRENNNNFPFRLNIRINELYSDYSDTYFAKRGKRHIEEIKKSERSEYTQSVMDKSLAIQAQEMREKLLKIPAIPFKPKALDAFIDYFKKPDEGFNIDKIEDYEDFLDLFYENINDPVLDQKDSNAKSICLNVAEHLEGRIQDHDGTSFKYVMLEKINPKNKNALLLIKSLKKFDKPSSSLLFFFNYLVNGKDAINTDSYWQLQQFMVNQKKAMLENLNFEKSQIFNESLITLNSDLREFAANRKSQ